MPRWNELKDIPEYRTEYTLDGEFWSDVPEYEDQYQVSNFGRVRSKDRVRNQLHVSGKMIDRFYPGKLISPDNSSGIKFGGLPLYRGKKKIKTLSIYVLMCMCFGQEYTDTFYYGEYIPTTLPNEVWKDVVGYEGLYKVSNLGRVKKPMGAYDIILRPFIKQYYVVTLSKHNKSKNYVVHRLVAQAFIPNPENKPEVNHIDGNKLNPNVTNLEWVTKSENAKHAYRTGLTVISSETRRKAALEAKKVISVPVYCKELDKLFSSLSDASRELGIHVANIHHASITNKPVNGYTFERRK